MAKCNTKMKNYIYRDLKENQEIREPKVFPACQEKTERQDQPDLQVGKLKYFVHLMQ